MSYEERNQSNKGYQRFRGTLHIAMGIFYVVIGSLIIFVKYFGAMELPEGFAYVLGGLMLAYGIFRIWRGITDLRQMTRRNMQRDFPSLRQTEDES